MIKNY